MAVCAGVVEAVLGQAVHRETSVGASIVDGEHLAAQDPPVARDCVDDLHVPGTAVARGEHFLLSGPAPLDGLPRLLRGQRGQRVRGGVDLAAEAAADGAAHHLDLAHGQLEVRAHDAEREVHGLGAGVDGEAPSGSGMATQTWVSRGTCSTDWVR